MRNFYNKPELEIKMFQIIENTNNDKDIGSEIFDDNWDDAIDNETNNEGNN